MISLAFDRLSGVGAMLLRYTLISLALLVGYAASATLMQAQTPATPLKIVVIDTAVFFNEKTGIIKIVAASKTLNTELASRRAEVQALTPRIDVLTKEIEALRTNAAKGIPVDQRTFQVKVEEADRLTREAKYRQDDFNAHAQRRQSEVVGPVYSEVLRILAEYVKTRDFGLIFDVSKDQNGMLLFASEKFDITREFITYYNTRPVSATSPVTR